MCYSDEEMDDPLSAMSVSNWCAKCFIATHENRFGVFHGKPTSQQHYIVSFTNVFIYESLQTGTASK